MSRSGTRTIQIHLGKSGSGKTYVAEQLLPHYPRPVFVLDTTREWESRGMQFESVEQLRKYLLALAKGKDVPDAPNGVHVLQAPEQKQRAGFFHLAHAAHIPGTYIIDEVWKYCSAHSINDDFLGMIAEGRHDQQTIIASTHRFADLHKNLSFNADAILAWSTQQRNDVKALPDRANGKVQSLSRHEFMILGGNRESVPWIDKIRQMEKCKHVERKR